MLIFFFSWVRNKLDKFFKRELDKNMKFHGFKRYSLDQRQPSLNMLAGLLQTYPGKYSPVPSSLSTSSVRDRANQPFFLFSKHPLKIILMDCLLQNEHRSPCIPVHWKLMVVYCKFMVAHRKLR